MKIDYNFTEAQAIMARFHSLPKGRSQAARAVRHAFIDALKLCGVRFVDVEFKNFHALNLYTADGKGFPKEQIDEYNLKRKSDEVWEKVTKNDGLMDALNDKFLDKADDSGDRLLSLEYDFVRGICKKNMDKTNDEIAELVAVAV